MWTRRILYILIFIEFQTKQKKNCSFCLEHIFNGCWPYVNVFAYQQWWKKSPFNIFSSQMVQERGNTQWPFRNHSKLVKRKKSPYHHKLLIRFPFHFTISPLNVCVCVCLQSCKVLFVRINNFSSFFFVTFWILFDAEPRSICHVLECSAQF